MVLDKYEEIRAALNENSPDFTERFLARQSRMINGEVLTPTPRSLSRASSEETDQGSRACWEDYAEGYKNENESETEVERPQMLTRSQARLLGIKPDEGKLPVFLGKRLERKKPSSSPSSKKRASKKTNAKGGKGGKGEKGGKSPRTTRSASSPKKRSTKSKLDSRELHNKTDIYESDEGATFINTLQARLQEVGRFHMQVDTDDSQFVHSSKSCKFSRRASKPCTSNSDNSEPSCDQSDCASVDRLPRGRQQQRQHEEEQQQCIDTDMFDENYMQVPATIPDDYMQQILASQNFGSMQQSMYMPSTFGSTPKVMIDEEGNMGLFQPFVMCPAPVSNLELFQQQQQFEQNLNMQIGGEYEQISGGALIHRQVSECSVDIPHEGIDLPITMFPDAVDRDALAKVKAHARGKRAEKFRSRRASLNNVDH